MILNWKVSKEDHDLIVKIAERGEAIADRLAKSAAWLPVRYGIRDALMDLTAVHANGNPLRLSELLAADEGDFTHDVFGIRTHLDRETGHLICFIPRFSAAKEAQ